jgi:hypothetical protein
MKVLMFDTRRTLLANGKLPGLSWFAEGVRLSRVSEWSFGCIAI